MIRIIKIIGVTAVLAASLILNPHNILSKSGIDEKVKESTQTDKSFTKVKTPAKSIKAWKKQPKNKVMKMQKTPLGKAMGTFPNAGSRPGKTPAAAKSGEQHGIAVIRPMRGEWLTTDDHIYAMFRAPECCGEGPFVSTLRRDGDPTYQEEVYTGNVDFYEEIDECGSVKANIDIPASVPEGHDYYLRIARLGQMCWGDSGAFSIVHPGSYPVEADETPTAIAIAPSEGIAWFDTSHLSLRWRVNPRTIPYIWWWGFEICRNGSCQDLDPGLEAMAIDFSNETRVYSFSIPSEYISESGTYSVRGYTTVMEEQISFTINDIFIEEPSMDHGIAITAPRHGYRLHRGRTYEVYWHLTGGAPECGTFTITPTVSIQLYKPDMSVRYGFAVTTNETIYYFAIHPETSPGEYVFVVTYGGLPPHLNITGDQACMWAISDTFTILGD